MDAHGYVEAQNRALERLKYGSRSGRTIHYGSGQIEILPEHFYGNFANHLIFTFDYGTNKKFKIKY